MQITARGVNFGKHKKDSHVELIAANEQRIFDVPLKDKVSALVAIPLQHLLELWHSDVIHMATVTAVIVFWFINPHGILVLFHV